MAEPREAKHKVVSILWHDNECIGGVKIYCPVRRGYADKGILCEDDDDYTECPLCGARLRLRIRCEYTLEEVGRSG